MTKLQKLILINIISAQIASDAGKGIFEIDFSHVKGFKTLNMAKHCGYNVKVDCQLKAINLIAKNPQCGCSFWVTENPDQNGYPSIITYFDIKIGDERFQMSFHNPTNRANELMSLCYTGRKTRWHKNKNCRESCKRLLALLNEEA